jgi:hypothetical protein
MKDETFYRGQYVYKEGINPVDKIYMIKKGEFLVSKKLIR